MGLFQSKQQAKQQPSADVAPSDVQDIFDEQYREDLRRSGREYFKTVITDSAATFKDDLDTTIAQVHSELKDYMVKRLDATVEHVNIELTKQLESRLIEHDRATKDAQDLAVKSLNRNAQALHDKYQQLGQMLQQTIASQEAMMITVFEENKARMTVTQETQDSALHTLTESAQAAQTQADQLRQRLTQAADEQQAKLATVFDDNMARVNATKDAQEKALQSLNDSADALQKQHQQLSQTLQQAVADQKDMLVSTFDDNMARIIEHYLLGALGDQYDMKAQLPAIIKQMEQNKQAIVDDMKL